jgi:hypothetical protein
MYMKAEIDTNTMPNAGENIIADVKDNHLIVVVDLSKEIGLSSTGKMMGVASTGGFVQLPGGVKGNIYIGKKP